MLWQEKDSGKKAGCASPGGSGCSGDSALNRSPRSAFSVCPSAARTNGRRVNELARNAGPPTRRFLAPIRHIPSRRPHESMNFRGFEPVNGAPKPVERRASHDALWRAASGGRRPLTGSRLRKQEAFIRSTALPVKRRRTPTRRACPCRRRADQSDGRMSRVAAGPSSGASRHSRAFADRR